MIWNLITPLSSTGTAVAFIRVTYPAGATCTAKLSSVTLQAPDTSGYWIVKVPTTGKWDVTAVDGTSSVTDSVRVTARAQSFTITLSFRVPTAYREVEYLQSSGTQYINPGFVWQSDLSKRINIKFALLDNITHSVGGTYVSQTGGSSILGFPAYLEGNGLYYNVAAGDYALSSATVNGIMTTIFNNASHQVLENGTTKMTITHTTYSCALPFFLFAVNVDGNAGYMGKTRIYYFQYIDNNTNELLADYIPVYRKSDTVYGFWDAVSETFITNSGTGSFTGGSAV